MEKGVIYAISIGGYNTRPGVVLDAGKPPNKCRVKVWWKWPNQEDDYLNPTPDITSDLAKFDDKLANTNEVEGLWSDYCAKVKAERAEAIAKRNAAEAEAEAEKQSRLDRLQAVAPLIEGFGGYCDMADLKYLFSNERTHDNRYSANHVLQLLEYVQMVTQGVSQ
jgi:hypothetical protein